MPPKKEDTYAKALAARATLVEAVMHIWTIILNLLAADPIVAEEVDETYALLNDKWTRLDKIHTGMEAIDLHPTDEDAEIKYEKARKACIKVRSRTKAYTKKRDEVSRKATEIALADALATACKQGSRQNAGENQ